uniref:F-box domain-containing protein n=1 Tax=Tetranychus urticae TaxID=32264 RepID=T1K4E4_TETUR
MLINELPDDCFVEIFDYIQDLKDLINCFKVCEKWSNLVADRTKKVKYFIDRPNYSPDSVFQQSDEPIDVAFLSEWFPNFRFDDLVLSPAQEKSPIEKFFSGSESLKGIICGKYFDFKLMPQKDNLEMLSLGFINPNRIVSNETVKQLNLWDSTLDSFKKVAHYFPNLKRLKISSFKDKIDYYSNGPVMKNLKIVELSGSSRRSPYIFCNSFVFMDSCPALQSAHIKIERGPILTIYSVKNANLQDLVLQLVSRSLLEIHLQFFLIVILFRHEDIKQLILILPKLTLLDVRKSFGVSQKAADLVQDYCKQYGRSIKFYFKKDDKQIESDWPQILNRPDKICRGFDFMEHCFFKSFNDLPHFLDPIDD